MMAEPAACRCDQHRQPGTDERLLGRPVQGRPWYPATSIHTFGNGVQVSCATVGETFFFSLMHVVPVLSIARARRITDRFLECLVGAAQVS
jgi:hypothetical protein